MKIIHIGQITGGLGIYIRNVIEYSDRSIEYVVISGKNDNTGVITRDGVPVKSYLTSLQRNINPAADVKALVDVIKIVRKEHPDVLHCHSAKGGAIGRTAGWITHTPTLYTPHAFSFLCSPNKKKRWIYTAVERITRFGAWLLACGESERQLGMDQVRYREEKSLCWHNCVASQIESGNSIANQEKYIVTIGRPSYQKNPIFLVDVISKVHRVHPELKFYLLGVGFYSPELEKMKSRITECGLEDVIVLKDWVDHEQTMDFVRGSYLYLTVARYEGLPLSVVEAMSMGKCIVASKVTGNIDCVRNGYNGLLQGLDEEKFAEALIGLLDDPGRIEEYGRNSRRMYEDSFDIRKRIGSLEAIYYKVSPVKEIV